MSNIDLTRIITAEDKAAAAAAARLAEAKAECRRRILAVADATAQINLAAAAAAGRLDAGQMQTYRAGLAWVDAMRAASAALAADAGPDIGAEIAAEASWPAVPAGVAALAALF